VAVIAGIAASDMCQSFARGRKTIMARAAGADHLSVIDRHDGCEYVRPMAVLANVRRVHVCRVLAGRFGAVMATKTIAADIDMVKVCWQPAERAVAVVASGAAGDMGWVLAGRNDAIVAGTAGANNLAVIDAHDRHENIGRMAVFAEVRRLNMR